MKITSVETIQLKDHPRHLWVLVHTDEGITGIGEGTDKPELTKAAIHNFCGEIILDQDPLRSEHLWRMMYDSANYTGYTGAEMRAIGMIDMALWDIKGKAFGRPVYELLGGKTVDRLKVYNTCISYGAVRDRELFLSDAGELAQSLLSEGITAMKIWPLDALSEETNGQYISRPAIRRGLEPFRKIRQAVGDRMEVAFEGHSRWNIPMAVRIAEELEEYDPLWFEDPILVDDPGAYKELREKIRLPILASERFMTKYQFHSLLAQRGACDIVMFDLSYCGGITEGKKIAAMADACHLPVTTHNCGSPVLTQACAHLLYSCPNTTLMETVRALYRTYGGSITDAAVGIKDGYIYLSDKPGLGISLLDDVLNRRDTCRQKTDRLRRDQMFAVNGDPWAQSPGDSKAARIEIKTADKSMEEL